MTSRRRFLSFLVLSSVLMSTPLLAYSQAYTLRWEAASGVYPNQGCPAWVLQDNAPGAPALAGGKLTLSTPAVTSNNMYYNLSAPDVVVATPTIVEFRCRYLSGASSTTARAPIMVNFHKGGFIVTSLAIALDRVSLLNGDVSVGSSTIVDTNDSFHTYKIVNSGTSVQIYYDAGLILTGSTYLNTNAGNTVMVVWGEASSLAYGSSEWEYVEINNATDPCPVSTQPATWGYVKSLYH